MREALLACEGVKDATVSYEKKTAIVIVEEDSADPDKLIAAVNATGRGEASLKQ